MDFRYIILFLRIILTVSSLAITPPLLTTTFYSPQVKNHLFLAFMCSVVLVQLAWFTLDTFIGMSRDKGFNMKIIKRGNAPTEAIYRKICAKCKTEFEFSYSEGYHYSDQRESINGLSIACPVCGETCHVDLDIQKPHHYEGNEETAV